MLTLDGQETVERESVADCDSLARQLATDDPEFDRILNHVDLSLLHTADIVDILGTIHAG